MHICTTQTKTHTCTQYITHKLAYAGEYLTGWQQTRQESTQAENSTAWVLRALRYPYLMIGKTFPRQKAPTQRMVLAFGSFFGIVYTKDCWEWCLTRSWVWALQWPLHFITAHTCAVVGDQTLNAWSKDREKEFRESGIPGLATPGYPALQHRDTRPCNTGIHGLATPGTRCCNARDRIEWGHPDKAMPGTGKSGTKDVNCVCHSAHKQTYFLRAVVFESDELLFN
jgi:hypothetical protein